MTQRIGRIVAQLIVTCLRCVLCCMFFLPVLHQDQDDRGQERVRDARRHLQGNLGRLLRRNFLQWTLHGSVQH